MSSSGKRKGNRAVMDTSDEDAVVTATSGLSAGDATSMEEVPVIKVKRLKHGSPRMRRAVSEATVAVDKDAGVVAVDRLPPKGAGRPKEVVGSGGGGSGGAGRVIADMKAITSGLMDVVFGDGVGGGVGRSVMNHAARYEGLLMVLLAENERLRGRLEAGGGGGSSVSASGRPGVSTTVSKIAAGVSPAAAVPAPAVKPVETWSVVVKGKKQTSSKEVVSKVVEQVGPTLGVRVHEVRPIKDGGAVIRTPSVAERRKIAENAKFAEVGLEVSVKDKLGPRITVQRVHRQISVDEFMEDLFAMNLKERMSREAFSKAVRMTSPPWVVGEGEVGVVLECTDDVAGHLRATGVYIKWFRFLVRVQDAVPCCYRCLGFDHRIRDCRMTQSVCRRCGQTGHEVSSCGNDLACRNCAFRGLPSGHIMMSSSCPVYAARMARANARH